MYVPYPIFFKLDKLFLFLGDVNNVTKPKLPNMQNSKTSGKIMISPLPHPTLFFRFSIFPCIKMVSPLLPQISVNWLTYNFYEFNWIWFLFLAERKMYTKAQRHVAEIPKSKLKAVDEENDRYFRYDVTSFTLRVNVRVFLLKY